MEKLVYRKKEGDILVFLLILLTIILMIITIRIKFEFINLKFTSLEKQHLNKNYQIKVIIYIFQKIPILKITNKKLEKVINNEKVKGTIKKQKAKIIENTINKDNQIVKGLKSVKLDIKEMNLKISIGTEDASITAFIIPVISTIIAMFLSKKVKRYNDKQIFSIFPIYINQNLINIEFSGIFQIKMIHIINTICILNKKKKGDKNERTSNRRSYDYSYEQY